MKNLEARIIRLEAGRNDPTNDFIYEMVCRFADDPPEKKNDVVFNLSEVLPS